MLRDIRKGMKPFMWVIIIAFVGSIFIWGASRSFEALKSKKANEIAKVGDYVIEKEEFEYSFQREFAIRLRSIEEQYQGNISPQVQEKLKIQSANNALEMLIGEYLLLTEAKKKGIVITDEEIRDTILSNKVFQTEQGVFNRMLYKRILAEELFMTPTEFEDMLRKQLANAKLMSIITGNVRYSEKDIRKYYNRYFKKYNISYIPFTLNEYLSKVDESEIDIEKYYKENKERFKKPKRAKIEFIKVEFQDVEEQVKISESEIKDYYEEHKREYIEAGLMHLKEIFVEIPEGADENLVITKQMKIKSALNELEKGVSFEEVARQYSEANSASMGGDIGFVDPQIKGEDYARAVYSLDEKAYTLEPIKTSQGLYIIYREEDIPDYDWSREKIKKTLQKLKIEKLTEMKAQDIYNSLSEDKPIDLVAKEMGLKVNTSEYFTEEGTIPGLGRFPDVAIKAFQMEPGQVGNIVPIYVSSIYPEPILTGYFVYTLKEITPAGVPQLEEIRDEVKADARRYKAITLAKRDALDIYENLSSSDLTMEIIVGQNNLIVEKVDGISPMSGTSEMGSGYQLMQWLENAETGEISEPLMTKKGVFIVRVDNQEEINSEDLKTQLLEIRDQLINTRSQEIYFDYYFPRRKEVEISVDMEQFLLGLSEEEAKYQQKMDELIQQKKKEKQNE